MIVEIYKRETESTATIDLTEQEELILLEVERIEDRRKKAEKLAMKGQVELLEIAENKLRTKLMRLRNGVSYKKLTADQHKILMVFFSRCRRSGEFRKEIIPVGAFEEIERAQNLRIFDKVEILYNKEDPIAVGFVKGEPEPYLIARWGDALQDWERIADAKYDEVYCDELWGDLLFFVMCVFASVCMFGAIISGFLVFIPLGIISGGVMFGRLVMKRRLCKKNIIAIPSPFVDAAIKSA